MASFSFYYLCKYPFSKKDHILTYGGWGSYDLSVWICPLKAVDTFQSIISAMASVTCPSTDDSQICESIWYLSPKH